MYFLFVKGGGIVFKLIAAKVIRQHACVFFLILSSFLYNNFLI